MSDIYGDGQVRVAYVPTIANINLPTTSELNAGILLNSLLTPDGLVGFNPTTADVDNSALDSTYDTSLNGRDSYSGTMLRVKKQTVGADTVKSTLTRNTTGYVAIRRGIPATTAWASGQEVEIYPIMCGRRSDLAPEKNTLLKYEIPTKIWQPPQPDAVVA